MMYVIIGDRIREKDLNMHYPLKCTRFKDAYFCNSEKSNTNCAVMI